MGFADDSISGDTKFSGDLRSGQTLSPQLPQTGLETIGPNRTGVVQLGFRPRNNVL